MRTADVTIHIPMLPCADEQPQSACFNDLFGVRQSFYRCSRGRRDYDPRSFQIGEG